MPVRPRAPVSAAHPQPDVIQDPAASDALYSAVYAQLKRMASRHLRAEHRDRTLSTTELVHEAYLKLGRHEPDTWESRAHFFGAASHAMREVLVEFARRRARLKRGSGWRVVSLSHADAVLEVDLDEMIGLDHALDELGAINERLRQVVELRFFGGVPERDIGHMLGVSPRTVERDWLKARLFLLQMMQPVM